MIRFQKKVTHSLTNGAAGLIFTALALSSATLADHSLADDACDAFAIHSLADVTVSDGLTYQVEGFYKSRHRAASRFIRDGGALHVVEGSNVWVDGNGTVELAGNFQRDYVLGHQFHAFLLRFADVVSDIERAENIAFAGGMHTGRKGVRDTGGAVYLIDGPTPDQPLGLRYDVGDLKIEITASNWRDGSGTRVPYALSINDGERVFDYRYQQVDLGPKPLMWFYDMVPEPALDVVGIERLHRKLLLAHCLGDPAMMASLTAPTAIVVNSGSVFETNPEAMTSTFTNIFARRTYSAYIDTRYPDVVASSGGDIGWAAVQVNAKGITPEDGLPFDENWAWVMTARKIDGQWRMAGNASNLRPR